MIKKNSMVDVHFLPFVGKEYFNGIHGKKVLILGESIYGDKDEDKDADAIKRHLGWYLNEKEFTHENWMNTYTKSIRALSGDFGLSRSNSKQWWNKVIFYNYVQEPLNDARMRPTDKMFHDAEKPLLEVLERYAPDVILVWGVRLGSHLPSCFIKGKNVILPDEDKTQCGTKTGTLHGYDIHALIMYHPSYSFFSPQKWHEMISQFLNDLDRQ